jgi:hypothetical protein
VAEDVDRVALLDDKSLQFVSILSAIDIVRFIAMRLSEKWSSTQLEGLQVREAFLHNRYGKIVHSTQNIPPESDAFLWLKERCILEKKMP